MNIQETDRSYVANTYARFPVAIKRGEGSLVWDESGKEYIDLSGGIAVNTFGMADPQWVEAVTAQLAQVQHTSNLYFTEPCAKLAELLCLRTGMKKVFFSNSGAEANECAVKVARKYAANTKGADHYTIVTLKNSFHGRTLTTLAATGQEGCDHTAGCTQGSRGPVPGFPEASLWGVPSSLSFPVTCDIRTLHPQ